MTKVDNNHIIPLKRKSWYKNCSPEDTIHRIRNILYDLGILITEESGHEQGFYHSHIYISNDELRPFNIMTNGKGTTAAYALASAYSEMMERLQNGYKFYGERYATKKFISSLSPQCEYVKNLRKYCGILDYASYADEVYFNIKDYLLSENNIFSETQTKYIIEYGDKDFLNNYELCCVPYYDIMNGESKYLPSDCFCSGTNGMCAGNTPSEALVQGFCEIFERYAIKQLMLYDSVPPQIPLNYFKGTSIYEKILKLDNLRIIVLDCSFQLDLPVLGTIIINTKEDTCCLEMAGAATAEVALERCLTEHFQSGNPSEDMSRIFDNVEYDDNTKFEQFYRQSKGFGKIDLKKLLSSEPQYEFKGFYSIIGDNSEEELSWIINKLIMKNGLQCFIRDNSILGYPTYHIYIPAMSDIYDNHNIDDLYITMFTFYLQPNVLNLKKQNVVTLKIICDNTINGFSKVRSSHIPIYANFLYNQETRESRPDNDLFVSTILLQCGDYEKASNILRKFIQRLNKTSDIKAIKYYNCALDYIQLKNDNSDASIYHKLVPLYGTELVDEIISDVNSENKLYDYDLPSCFNCEVCEVKEACCYFNAMKVVKALQDKTILKNQNAIISMINSLKTEDAENPLKSRRNY